MKLLIWGTGSIAIECMRCGYFGSDQIVGFVDTYKKKESFLEAPVYFPKDLCNIEYDKLIVCVLKDNNQILKQCRGINISEEKLYFLHTEDRLGGVCEQRYVNKLKEIQKEYPMVYKCVQNRVEQFLYVNSAISLETELKDDSLIWKCGSHHVITWVPIELIFSEKRTDIPTVENWTEEWEKQNSLYQDIPLIGFKPYRVLFEFFSRGESFPAEYCYWYQNLFLSRGMRSGYTDEQLIEKRYREYKIMKNELQDHGFEFFVNHPAIGKWNENGYINLLDGHHRTFFLYNAGFRNVPIQLSKEDYLKWKNEEQARKVKDIILKQKRTEFYQPILNPYFMKLHPHRENVVKSRLHLILEYFNNTRMKGKKVIDIGANLGYFGMEFARMGAEVDLIEPDELHYELTSEVVKLMQVKNTVVITSTFEELSTDKTYDIAILLTVFYHYMDDSEIRNKFIENLNHYVTSMIIWESGGDIEEEKQYITENTKFKDYVHLGYTYATGKFRELGIFLYRGY